MYKNIDGVYTDIFLVQLRNHISMQSVYLSVSFLKPFGRAYPDCLRGMLRYYLMETLNKLFKIYSDKQEESFLFSLNKEIQHEFGIEIIWET
jgi:hypothetical protein